MPFRSLSALTLIICFPLTLLAQEKQPTKTATTSQIKKRVLIPLGEMEAATLVDRWAEAARKISVVAPEVRRIKIDIREAGDLSFEEIRALLAFHQVIVHERGSLLMAHSRRNLYDRIDPTDAPVLGPKQPLPKGRRLVTRVLRIQHGSGSSIFATVRGLLARDRARLGQILYVPGSESIVVHDEAPKVAYYETLIRALDVPPASPRLTVTVYELPRSAWRALRKQHPGSGLAAAVAKAAATQSNAVLDEVELTSLSGQFTSKKELRDRESSIALTLSTRTVRPTKRGATEHMQVELDLLLGGPQGSVGRKVTLPIPTGFLAGQTRVSSFSLREGTQPTQLVLVVKGG